MDEPIVVGIDIGTTKICTLVARVEGEGPSYSGRWN